MIEQALTMSDTAVHRLDPRVKVISTVSFSVVVAVLNRFSALGFALLLGVAVVVVARIPVGMLFRRVMPVNGFILFLWFFLPFTIPGQPLFSLGPLTGTHEGVLYAARVTLKSNAMMLVLIALVASTSMTTLGHAMHLLRVPDKIVHLFFFTYRYVHVIHREYLRLAKAMKIRGFSPGTNWHTYKTYAYMIGMLLVRSCDRAQRLYDAMLCRGFNGRFYSFSEFSLRGADIVSLALTAMALCVLGVLEWITAV